MVLPKEALKARVAACKEAIEEAAKAAADAAVKCGSKCRSGGTSGGARRAGYPMRGQGAPLIVARARTPKSTRVYRSIYIAFYRD